MPTMKEQTKVTRKKTYYVQKLSGKGFIFVGMLLAYAAFLILVVLQERDLPLKQLEAYQQIQEAESALVQADLAAFHVVTTLLSNVNNNDMRTIVQYFSVLREQYDILTELFPEKAESFKQFVETLTVLLREPTKENFMSFHSQLTHAKQEIDQLLVENRGKRELLLEEFRTHSDHVVITTLTLGIIGLTLLGGTTSLFFMQLTKDINRLRLRVSEIMNGYRGAPLSITRKDELGELTSGVNHMAQTLKEKEKELELERRKSSYQEKMNAIETLAGGIAHEIGNPIACISGLAQEIQDLTENKLDAPIQHNLQSIQNYSEGLSRITRDLSVMSASSDDQSQLLDFNQLITTTTGLLQYDKRWDAIQFEYDLMPNLPAISGFSDQLSLLLNNLLENSLDALNEQKAPGHSPKIKITTHLLADSDLILTIKDNGKGMAETIQHRAFEPFYSTKPVGQGSGLGLSLCWSIISTHKGEIKLSSVPEKGTTIEIRIPTDSLQNLDVAYG